jgi:hypothetical protein
MFIVFLSAFAVDVFGESLGFWRTMLALTVHLVPSFVLIVALILAWRWEWVGATVYGGAAALYVIMLLSRPLPPLTVKLFRIALIAGPAFVIAALFLANWLKRDQLRVRTR